MSTDRFERAELKYFVTPAEISAIRAMVAPFTQPDEYACGRAGNIYTVRSIYFDTPDLRFYYEKDAGVKIRKKLRLRTYNCREDCAPAFFEIKRKYANAILKERVRAPLERALAILDHACGSTYRDLLAPELELSAAGHASLTGFMTMKEILRLCPSVLVVYEREAYVGQENPRVRVTFDCHVRSVRRPRLDEIFAERGLRHITDRRQILELKFNGPMPFWMRSVTARLGRSNQAISKYCRGIDAWQPLAV
jgi:SPX domain protein involved in polyphosphate accumulation